MRLTIHIACTTLAGFAAFAPSALAQEAQLAGPVLGYVFDPAIHALRPVLGIPGAATVGMGIEATAGAQSAFVAPRQDSAAVMDADGKLVWYNLKAGVTPIPWSGAGETPRQVVFSPSGTAVALVGANGVRVFTGLPAELVAGATIELGTAIPRPTGALSRPVRAAARLGAVAVSDDGLWVMAVVSGEARVFSAAGASFATAQAGSGARVAFARGTHDAAIADDANGPALTWVHDVSGAASLQLVSQDGHLAHPVGLAFSADGKSLLVSTADQAVVVADLAGAKVTAQSCACMPGELQAMGNVFRLNELGQGPLWVLDAQTAAPRLLFVPPPASSN